MTAKIRLESKSTDYVLMSQGLFSDGTKAWGWQEWDTNDEVYDYEFVVPRDVALRICSDHSRAYWDDFIVDAPPYWIQNQDGRFEGFIPTKTDALMLASTWVINGAREVEVFGCMNHALETFKGGHDESEKA